MKNLPVAKMLGTRQVMRSLSPGAKEPVLMPCCLVLVPVGISPMAVWMPMPNTGSSSDSLKVISSRTVISLGVELTDNFVIVALPLPQRCLEVPSCLTSCST